MTTTHIIFLMVMVFISGCGPLAREEVPSIGMHEDVPRNPDTTDHAIGGISLDNGHQWKADPSTTSGVIAMRDLLEGYPANGIEAVDLKDTLETEFALIFERCTMTGEAHEHLHTFLLPLHDMLRELPAEAPPQERAEILTHLRTYETYFE